MSLSSNEYKNILDIVDSVYSASDKCGVFQQTFRKLRGLLDISSALFIPVDARTGSFQVDEHRLYVSSESVMLSCLVHYASLDPSGLISRFLSHLNDGAARFGAEDSLRRSFDCELPIPPAGVFYVLGSATDTQGELVGFFAIRRCKRSQNFSAREKEIYNLILPHMGRALQAFEMRRDAGQHAVPGFIALGEEGEPCFMNEVAKDALGDMPVASLPDPGEANQAYFRGRSGIFRVRAVPAGHAGNGKFIMIEQHPAEKKIMMALEEYKLGHRAGEVAALAVQGLSNREIADALFICEQTVKDYLHDVFGKLKIKRRSELAAKVLELDVR